MASATSEAGRVVEVLWWSEIRSVQLVVVAENVEWTPCGHGKARSQAVEVH